MSVADDESGSRHPVYTHWAPYEVDTVSPLTACGMNIDTPKPLAWTRSRDIAEYQGRPYEGWPKPCPECLEKEREMRQNDADNDHKGG